MEIPKLVGHIESGLFADGERLQDRIRPIFANLDEAAAIRARESARCTLMQCLSDMECAKTLAEATAQLQAIDRLRRQGGYRLGK